MNVSWVIVASICTFLVIKGLQDLDFGGSREKVERERDYALWKISRDTPERRMEAQHMYNYKNNICNWCDKKIDNDCMWTEVCSSCFEKKRNNNERR